MAVIVDFLVSKALGRIINHFYNYALPSLLCKWPLFGDGGTTSCEGYTGSADSGMRYPTPPGERTMTFGPRAVKSRW